jgi:hypothetical protein
MIQRTINPKPRFVTLISALPFVGAPLGTLHRTAFFNFPQDSVIHYVSINSTFSVDGAFAQVTGAVAYGQGQTTITSILGAGLENFDDGIIWRDELLNPAAGTVSDSKSNQIMFNEFFVHAGTIIGIYANGLNGNARINATISFNPIAEWTNFREPTIGVRI